MCALNNPKTSQVIKLNTTGGITLLTVLPVDHRPEMFSIRYEMLSESVSQSQRSTQGHTSLWDSGIAAENMIIAGFAMLFKHCSV